MIALISLAGSHVYMPLSLPQKQKRRGQWVLGQNQKHHLVQVPVNQEKEGEGIRTLVCFTHWLPDTENPPKDGLSIAGFIEGKEIMMKLCAFIIQKDVALEQLPLDF